MTRPNEPARGGSGRPSWPLTSITCPKPRRKLALSEATVYLVIADLLDALEYKPPAASDDEIHRRTGIRPASQTEVTRFHQQFGPFDIDSEG